MAMTNAEKQQAWRERRESRIAALEKQVAELEADNERLRARIAKYQAAARKAK